MQVLYESHSVIHGRPFPLKGRFVANIFIHFEPAGGAMSTMSVTDEIDVADLEELPNYILPDSPEAKRWHKMNPSRANKKNVLPEDMTPGSTILHLAAQENDLRTLKRAVQRNQEDIHAKDENGWYVMRNGKVLSVYDFD